VKTTIEDLKTVMKTQTRRLVKLGPDDFVKGGELWRTGRWGSSAQPCPYGAPGEYLWVRETWAPCTRWLTQVALLGHTHYRADGAVGRRVRTSGGREWWERTGHTLGLAPSGMPGAWVVPPARWRPSVHMPRWASRILLEVTAVRIERLQSISEADALAEGVERVGSGFRAYDEESPPFLETDPRFSFRSLWRSTNGADSWAANPWVWVMSFERVPLDTPMPTAREWWCSRRAAVRPILFQAHEVRAVLATR
jgi:hypothetical protein